MFVKSLVSSCVVAIMLSAAILHAQEKKSYFRVMGNSSDLPNETITWSEPFESRTDAETEMAKIKRDHEKGGLLAGSSDKPTNLHIVEFTANGQVLNRKPPKTEEPLKSNAPRGTVIITKPDVPVVDPGSMKGQQLKPKRDVGDAAKEPDGKYTVWVFKLEGAQWMKQNDRSYGTDDADQARDYADKVKAVAGWTATTNAPPDPNKAPVAPGSYSWTYRDQDLVSNWSILVQPNGTVNVRITSNDGHVKDVTGEWKTEAGAFLVKWTSVSRGGVINNPAWQDLTDQVKKEWKRN